MRVSQSNRPLQQIYNPLEVCCEPTRGEIDISQGETPCWDHLPTRPCCRTTLGAMATLVKTEAMATPDVKD